MAEIDFKTVPDELMHVALDVHELFENDGHEVRVEIRVRTH